MSCDLVRLPTLPHSGLDPRVLVCRGRGQVQQRPRPWEEVIVGVLGVDPGLE